MNADAELRNQNERLELLLSLTASITSSTEGGTHSAVRHANEAGITPQEMEHVVLLSITTIGIPAAGRALTWIHDKTE